jgi:hypothetical protein
MIGFGGNKAIQRMYAAPTPDENKTEDNMKNKIECIFCDYVAENLNDLKEHSTKCEKHPLWKEIIKLNSELDERCQQLANYDYEHWDDLRDANALISTLIQLVPKSAAGWCYVCSTVVETYHYGGSGNPQCCKCKSSNTDSLSDTMEEYITKLQSILYKKET